VNSSAINQPSTSSSGLSKGVLIGAIIIPIIFVIGVLAIAITIYFEARKRRIGSGGTPVIELLKFGEA
jgi:Ca2+/Na+ antiporter